MFKFINNAKSKKNKTIPEYEEYLAIYSAQFINMTNEQLQEDSLKSELEKRNQKKY